MGVKASGIAIIITIAISGYFISTHYIDVPDEVKEDFVTNCLSGTKDSVDYTITIPPEAYCRCLADVMEKSGFYSEEQIKSYEKRPNKQAFFSKYLTSEEGVQGKVKCAYPDK